MAFAVTAFKAYPKPIDQAVIKRFEYCIEMYITNLATDTDCDIGDTTTPGQFFTDAEADVTYGATATALKTLLNNLKSRISHADFTSETLETSYMRTCGAPLLGNEFQVVRFTSHIPELLFVSGGAPTSWKMTMNFRMDTGDWPVEEAKYGTDI